MSINSSLLVVIVNYKTADLTIDCLHSVAAEIKTFPNVRVMITDNASPDDSVKKIQTAITQQHWQDWASLMPLERNGGFAYGNNAAIKTVLDCDNPPDYILLLNPDTIVHNGAFKALVSFMDSHPEVGIAGSRLEEIDGTPQMSAFRFQSIWSELDSGFRLGVISKLLAKSTVWFPIPDKPCQTDWVSGASMLVRTKVFQDIGLMDEKYFMYYEEMDFCLQASKANWSCWYVPESRVVHLVGQSSGVGDPLQPPKRLPKYWFDSRKHYFLKNYGLIYTVLADFLHILGYASWKVRQKLQKKQTKETPYFLNDLIENSVLVKALKSK